MNIALVLNRNAGTLRGLDPDAVARDLAGIFRAQDHQVDVEVVSGSEAVAAIGMMCRRPGCDAIVVGGGDGTISAAAAAAAENGSTLGVLPLGTMNLFARSLGIPLNMRAAAEALANGSRTHVDIGDVNGRPFVHHVTLGLHPRMIRVRERLSYGSRWGKILAGAQAWWLVLRHPRRLKVRITADGRAWERRAAVVLISNNVLGEGHLPYSDDLRQGKLGLYLSTSRRRQDILRLAVRMTLGEFSANPLLETSSAREIQIALQTPVVNASLDGEIVSLQTPLRVSVREGGLSVLRPGPARG